MASGTVAKVPFDFQSFTTDHVVSSVDLDDFLETGVWYCYGGLTNSPQGNYGYLICFYASSTTATQVYFPAGSNYIYYRRRSGSAWANWYRLTGTEVT